MASKLFNEGPKWIFMFLWIGGNIALFLATFFSFYGHEEYFYLNCLTGLAVPIAKSSAACINLNSLLIILPVCRNLLSFVRGSCIAKVCRRNNVRLLDKNIAFHKACAYMIVFFTAIHYYAHTFNVENFINAYSDDACQSPGLLLALSKVGRTNNTWVNPIATNRTNPMLELIKLVPGYTGIILTLALIIIMSSASEVIRRSYFELFWFTHHLFIVYFVALVTHGLGKTVRCQTNLHEHDVDSCYKLVNEWGTNPECAVPTFGSDGATSYMWVVGPIAIYIIERTIRVVRSFQKVQLIKVVKHPSKVMELQMKKSGFKMESGQYVFIKCPSISRLEWHPFTLTSAPGDDYFSVHVRIAGDWTTALSKACHWDTNEQQHHENLPRLAVDGPFGTASEDIYKYKSVILVGAGIGVTPFASVLKDIWYKQCNPNFEMKTAKVYFYWICPDTNAFEWFSDLLKYLEQQMHKAGKEGLLEYNIYLTRGWNSEQAYNIATHEEDVYDVITGLRTKTIYGRPNWDTEFSKVATEQGGTRIGVFFCGPKVLSTELHKMSNKHSEQSSRTFFVYNKENF